MNGPTGKLTLHDNNMRNLNIETSGRSRQQQQQEEEKSGGGGGQMNFGRFSASFVSEVNESGQCHVALWPCHGLQRINDSGHLTWSNRISDI